VFEDKSEFTRAISKQQTMHVEDMDKEEKV